MRDYTTEEVIKIIPLDEERRKQILNDYPTYEEACKYEVGRACWRVFHQFRKEVTDVIYLEFMNEVEAGERKMDETFMDSIEKAVDEEFTQILNGKIVERSQIHEIRSKLEGLMEKK